MNKVYFSFNDDVLFKNVPFPQGGKDCYQSEVVIDKETFLECVKRWMTEIEDKKS